MTLMPANRPTETPLTRRRLVRLAWGVGLLGLGAPFVAACQPANRGDDNEDDNEDDEEEDD